MSMNGVLPKNALEAMAFEEKILPCGLCLRLKYMPDYSASHVIYSTGFGAVHRVYEDKGGLVRLPAGIAHFLEHKMFENSDGVDAFTLFGETGALANAYTGFDRTSYIFTSANEIEANLDILLSFVSKPYFTKESVEKEQGIIGQEIKMYQDSPDIRLYYTLLENMYLEHPVRDDIVGTVESIGEISPEMLYSCCENFYSPKNMVLCAAGNVTMKQLEQAVERAGLPMNGPRAPKAVFPSEPRQTGKRESSFEMPVSMPLFALGFKEELPEGSSLKTEICCNMLTELICGETSSLYRRLYDSGLVQPGFGGEYGCYGGTLHIAFSGESPCPERVREEIIAEIKRQREEGINLEQFETCKKMMYGESIAELENVERVAYSLASSYFRGRTPAGELEAIASISPGEVMQALKEMLREEYSSFVTINPASLD